MDESDVLKVNLKMYSLKVFRTKYWTWKNGKKYLFHSANIIVRLQQDKNKHEMNVKYVSKICQEHNTTKMNT